VIALHKPYGVLSQFTPDGSPNRPLRELSLPDDVWPVGRLDADSEGLLILSARRELVAALLEPRRKHPREYWVQVEREPDEEALERLRRGVEIKGHHTLPCVARRMEEPELPPRDPPIRFRKTVPTAWLSLELVEGKNRQVRRMTAAVGYPTLRLFRWRIGGFVLGDIAPGQWRELDEDEIASLLSTSERASEKDEA
jgi:23S rRNA pseudouridine2457 synthase